MRASSLPCSSSSRTTKALSPSTRSTPRQRESETVFALFENSPSKLNFGTVTPFWVSSSIGAAACAGWRCSRSRSRPRSSARARASRSPAAPARARPCRRPWAWAARASAAGDGDRVPLLARPQAERLDHLDAAARARLAVQEGLRDGRLRGLLDRRLEHHDRRRLDVALRSSPWASRRASGPSTSRPRSRRRAGR